MNDKEEFLKCFECFLIDEAHELHKSSLMILAILRNFVKKNGTKHKMIVTSATLETALFTDYFIDMQVQMIEAVTPTFDVQVFYTQFPDLSKTVTENTAAHLRVIFEHIRNKFSLDNNLPNILVFLPSIKHIKDVKTYIEKDFEKHFSAIMADMPFNIEELHGGLKPYEKDFVFRPNPRLKHFVRIILATKIAETAITLDDIYYVLDSGLETDYFFDENTKMDYNKVVQISKSSAIQRKGRAGRIANGFCFKMYSESEENQFQIAPTPEILRMDIADVILTQLELDGMFIMSELLFYDKLDTNNSKISQVSKELDDQGATKVEGSKKIVTNKGKFMVQTNLKGQTSAFLYECIRYGARELGIIAATALSNPKGLFSNRVV